ncbi:MAG: hypothetical protein V1835_01030, partial [Candidatus Micrarchaeota archaeon]
MVLALLVLALAIPAAAAEEFELPNTNTEPTMVIINSNKWQDAYLASIYSTLNGYNLRFILDPFQTNEFMQELSTNRQITKVILFSRKDSAVPSLTYLLHSQNLDVREYAFEDHHDLGVQMLGMIPSEKVVVIRDDFAFDALSAKYLAQELKAPVVFSKGAEEMDGRVMDALNSRRTSTVYLVGRPSPKLEAMLANFNLNKLQGRDEYDTNNMVNQLALGDQKMVQGTITTGDMYELALMNLINQPIFLVPEF